MDLRSPSASHSAHRHSVDTWLLCRVFNSELTSIAHVARYCSTQSLSALTSVLDAWAWRQEALTRASSAERYRTVYCGRTPRCVLTHSAVPLPVLTSVSCRVHVCGRAHVCTLKRTNITMNSLTAVSYGRQ